MNITLWVAQILLALTFALSGTLKAAASKKWLLASGQSGLTHIGVPFIRFIALCELLGAAGLIAPTATGIAGVLTPLAAVCLAVIMIGAANAHARQARENPGRRSKEFGNIATNAVLFVLCAVVAVGRGLQLG
jgi:uncharacterized membrane protein YphA (DoxX/SURF4 family)